VLLAVLFSITISTRRRGERGRRTASRVFGATVNLHKHKSFATLARVAKVKEISSYASNSIGTTSTQEKR
jgi:hypothetical protein